MELKKYLSERGRQTELARNLGVPQAIVSQWASGKRSVPPDQAPSIEKVTRGAVTRRDLRPDDWFRIWPELITKAHPAPVEKACA